jgi:succinate dehydrogenase/fumarate reductase flavoprotein subunit
MLSYEDHIGKKAPDWPYEVNYGKENEISADVLIVGGGIAGCHAAIAAAKKGASVAVVDKAPIVRSGSGGAGVDHWGHAYTNPRSPVSPEQLMLDVEKTGVFIAGHFVLKHTFYIAAKESYEALLDMEQMGMKIRDEEDDFLGSPMRDDETKLLYAYNYHKSEVLRVQGANVKPLLNKEMKRLGIKRYGHIMITQLLSEDGKQGNRIVGATGVHIRTGEFYIFRAKATIITTAQPLRIWIFNTELVGSNVEHDDPNLAGDGHAMAWEAGAELTMMEASWETTGPFRYPAYGTGNCHNTWYPCSIVDANGKNIPWIDKSGKELKTVEERILADGPMPDGNAMLPPDLPQKIANGEYELPFYADLTDMPELERRAIFGLMVGHEGKTRIPIYENYTNAGFDPDKDMLQANVLPPDLAGLHIPWWDSHSQKSGSPLWRTTPFLLGGGIMVDWEMKTNLEGLYAAGAAAASGWGHAHAAATGRYVGRNAAYYASIAREALLSRSQIEKEKKRVYAPINREGDIGWKELQAGICRIMQDYCGEFRSEKILKTGLWWLNSIKESEAKRTYIRNPHELVRYLECMTRLKVGELMMHSSLVRKASNFFLGFKRMDYPETNPPEWEKLTTVRLENGEVKTRNIPFDFCLKAPYLSEYKDNYKLYSRA